MGTKTTDNDLTTNGLLDVAVTDKPSVLVDYERYAHFLKDSDLSDEDKAAFLETIWNIVVSFVDLGFGVHPIQQAQEACGQVGTAAAETPNDAKSAVQCKSTNFLTIFSKSADPETKLTKGGTP
ncbi:MAG: hypothetical protein HRU11_07770 [Parvularculaceae bacterium]|nr:hypothetical protein [Parvularculaceae bacterium]